MRYRKIVIGYWLLVIGKQLSVIGYWLLVIDYYSKLIAHSSKLIAHSSKLLFIYSLFAINYSFSQKLTFADNIAPIIYQNCTPCHRAGEAAPFSLITYQDVVKKAKFIKKVTEIRYMPPWKAEHDFGSFKNERRLTERQIATIAQWIDAGMEKGDLKKIKTPSFINGSLLNTKPDLTLKLNQPFNIPQTNQEGFYFFSLPINLPENKLIKAVEFRPGNKKLVHHSRISIDTTQKMRAVDGKSLDDPSIQYLGGVRMMEDFWYGWVPGNNPFIFPKKTAKFLPKNSDLLVNIHYAPNTLPETDQSTVNLFFAKDTIEREVKTFILAEDAISNPPFEIQPNETKTFYARSQPIPYDISMISVEPHLHKLGKTVRSFAISPFGEVIPFVKINDWDFNFQETYQFKNFVKVPKGSIIFAEATYDNTLQNPQNPFRPTQKITYGWNTTSEMMNIIFQFVIFQEGD